MPRKHPVPTAASLKELYANAYRCAHPGCKRPLYLVDDESGARTLNSTAAHICARSEGGPRWDPQQSQEANMSTDNLIALCREHSAAVDDPKNQAKYPTLTLRGWKAQQLAEFDALGHQGWALTDGDCRSMQRDLSIANLASDTVVNLGGTGGSAPGAGGGGGGVYGSAHSTGGTGGKGGDRINLDGKPATAPGAGGGGGGVLGDGAIASEGGGGGEIVEAILEVTPGELLRIDIGEGGKDGLRGGNTRLSRINPDGSLSPLIEAKGGAPGRPGQHGDLSELARELKQQEVDAGAGVTALLIAEWGRIKGNLATLLDAGWDTYTLTDSAVMMTWPVFLAFSTRGIPVGSVIRCTLVVRDTDERVVIQKDVLFPKLSENSLNSFFCEAFSIQVSNTGIWSVEVFSGPIRLSRIFMRVQNAT